MEGEFIWSATAIARDVNSGARTAVEIMTEVLMRVRAYDAIQPQAWISRAAEAELLSLARTVDQHLASGAVLPLAGVPVAIKDNIDVAGFATTAACPAFSFEPKQSAFVVERLIQAGAIVVGKTNLDQFATGLVGTRSPYGVVGCVFNRAFISGGSSSGSAALVAAGVVPLALGSDTAGSGRVPAAFNHLIGYKPTRGRWSTRGLLPACRSLDCISVFATDPADVALVDGVLAQFDAEDAFARRVPSAARALGARFRFGVAKPGQLAELGPEDAQCLSAARARLEEMGGTAIEVDVAPLTQAARQLYGGPWVAERTAVLEDLLDRDPGAIHPTVRAIVQAGKGLSAIDAFRGLYAQQSFARAAERIWDQVEVLLLPTTPTIFRISEVLAEPIGLNAQLGIYTNFVNLLDMCAIALPAGFRRNGTGVGVSVIGPAWADDGLMALAARYAAATNFDAPPLDTQARPASVQLAVVGAHLAGMPLHWQLTSRAARLVRRAHTAALYRLYAMTAQVPAKPALVHAGPDGAAIEVEIYELEVAAFGSFVTEVPPPLAIGTVQLDDGSSVKGFVAEPRALIGAIEITADGGWRAYLNRLAASARASGAQQ
jgi:allophanate hydrolase